MSPDSKDSLLLLFQERVVLVVLHTIERNLRLELLVDSLVCSRSLRDGAYSDYESKLRNALVS